MKTEIDMIDRVIKSHYGVSAKKIKIKERDVLYSVKQYLELKGFRIWRINNTGTWNAKTQGYYFHGSKGLPDLIAIKNNLLLLLECKSSTGKATKEQLEFFKMLEVVDTVEGRVVRTIEDIGR